MDDAVDTLALSLIDATRASARPVPLPAEPDGLTLDKAYAVQRRTMAAANLPVMVWKLGLTGDAPRAAMGAREPAVGRLPASAIYSDQAAIAYRAPEMYAEAELVFEFGHDLPAHDRPYTRAEICAALKGIWAGIEIVRTRFATSDLPLNLLVADNVMAHGLVLGRKLADGWDERFAAMPATLVRTDRAGEEERVAGDTARVMGDPLGAVVWLANWLRANEGRSLQREQLVAAGTCTGATEIFAGDKVCVGFDGVEAARVTLLEHDEKEYDR